jgi:hypothetical protein
MFSPPSERPEKENPGDATPGRYIGTGDETPGTTLVKLSTGGEKNMMATTPVESARV